MLEPLSAISLASAIVQFVDFSTKLVSGSLELYRSTDSACVTDVELESVATDIVRMNDRFTTTRSANVPGDASQDEAALRNLALSCNQISKELLQALDNRKIRGPHKRWQSFRKALAVIWEKERVGDLEKRLTRIQSHINSRIIIMISEQQSMVYATLSRVANEGLIQLKEEILAAIAHSKDSPASSALSSDLSMKLVALVEGAKVAEKEERILSSLKFTDLNTRRQAVKDAYCKTFDWMFEDNELSSRPHPNFVRWIKSEHGIYWVAGKAGSGKSTLMKFLVNDPSTYDFLSTWAGQNKLVVANFFFWNAGSSMQKSQQGLLQSLVYEVLQRCRQLIPAVCSARWEGCDTIHPALQSWTRYELLEVLKQLTTQIVLPAKFCFFIDGLDEYDGDTDELIRTLHAFGKLPGLKLCLSSRPWNEFNDAFSADRSVMLQDYTKDDIQLYAHQSLNEDHRLAKTDPKYQALLEDIVNKAQGVFLWVALVVRSCVPGLTNADDIYELQEKIRYLPSDLEAFFQHMFDSIDKSYQEQTARIFRAVVDAVRPPTVVALANIEEERKDPRYWLKAEIRPYSPPELKHILENMKKRLNARCKGMLEINKVDYDDSCWYTEYQVEFLHRTVRDFLQAPHMRILLERWTAEDFNTNIALCKALLVQIKAWPVQECPIGYSDGNSGWADSLDAFMCHSRTIEEESGLANVPLIDNLNEILQAHSDTMNAPVDITCNPEIRSRKGYNPVFSLLALAVEHSLVLYVTEKLIKDPALIQKNDGSSLLDYALRPNSTRMGYYFAPARFDMGSPTRGTATPWALFLERRCLKAKRHIKFSDNLFQVIELLIQHGADPDV